MSGIDKMIVIVIGLLTAMVVSVVFFAILLVWSKVDPIVTCHEVTPTVSVNSTPSPTPSRTCTVD